MDNETFRITRDKIEKAKFNIWEELARTTRKTKDNVRVQKLLELYDDLDNAVLEFEDLLEPESKKRK